MEEAMRRNTPILTLSAIALIVSVPFAASQELAKGTDQASLPAISSPHVLSDHARTPVEPMDPTLLIRRWLADPASREINELAENAWDFSTPDGVPGFGPLPSSEDLPAAIPQAAAR
jgi:hypothetical protein